MQIAKLTNYPILRYFGHEEIKSIMSESVKMKRFDHPNVISLIGVCVDAGPAPYIMKTVTLCLQGTVVSQCGTRHR